jgi:HAD superfamily hydrolase (TIGR01509 family)
MSIPLTGPWVYRSVVFDLDGILVDTEPIFEESARRMLRRRGLDWTPEVAQAMMGTPAEQAFVFFRQFYHLTESIAELVAESSVAFYEVLGPGPAPLMPGAVELLDRLRRKGIPKAIATSSSARYVEKVLRPHGLLDHFKFVLTCEDVRLGKPHPEVYEKAARKLGHGPSEMIILEDSINGVKAAKAAGAQCVAVPHARVQRDHLAAADHIVTGLDDADLLTLLGV